jgi:hypothetical protein
MAAALKLIGETCLRCPSMQDITTETSRFRTGRAPWSGCGPSRSSLN